MAGLGLVAVSPIAIKVLFGGEFYPDSFLPLVLLMPGIVAASATRVLGSYLFSQGKVIYNTYATLIALGAGHRPRLRRRPAVPRATARRRCRPSPTSVALIATLYWYRQVSGQPIREALIPHRTTASTTCGCCGVYGQEGEEWG